MNWTCAKCGYMNCGLVCTNCGSLPTNPVQPVQDRAEDLLDNWRKYGYVMFPQQIAIYREMAKRLTGSVLEAGCGNGVGSALLERWLLLDAVKRKQNGSPDNPWFVATDSLESNVHFSFALYPWIDFRQWDICHPWYGKQADAVVCVECLEHVADPQSAVRNLLAAARREVWISTPNGRGKPRPPSNIYHVSEYTPEEMITMICLGCGIGQEQVEMLNWEDFKPVGMDTLVDPLVYHIVKEQR